MFWRINLDNGVKILDAESHVLDTVAVFHQMGAHLFISWFIRRFEHETNLQIKTDKWNDKFWKIKKNFEYQILPSWETILVFF